MVDGWGREGHEEKFVWLMARAKVARHAGRAKGEM
jgi:hypothetical protein